MARVASPNAFVTLHDEIEPPLLSADRRRCFTAKGVLGFAIVSDDGMVADASGVMPDALKFDADQAFFQKSLEYADVIVHGRNSHEKSPCGLGRKRLIVSSRVYALERADWSGAEYYWNPQGASFENALAALEEPDAIVAVIGATAVFGLFLDRYDLFFLTQGANVQLPDGRPVFPGVPERSPESILASHGLLPCGRGMIDPLRNLAVSRWRRLRPYPQTGVTP